MPKTFTRRDFIKLSGLGTAASAILTGCGPTSRYVLRQQYAEMPEYNQTGVNTYFSTTCMECPAGCGMIVRTREGRATGIEGNPNHPVNRGKLCTRGLTALQGLYNPDRTLNPLQRSRKGESSLKEISWETAISNVADMLKTTPPGEIVFLLGLAPDHIYDLAKEITQGLGAPEPYRFGALGMFDGQATLHTAVKQVFNIETMPYFDFGKSDLVVSFGANFLETWLSPVAFGRAYRELRQGTSMRRGYFIALEPRQSLTSASADEWIAVTPGSENLIARALGKLITELKELEPSSYFQDVDVQEAADLSGVPIETLEHIASLVTQTDNSIFLPGGSALTHQNGLETAQAILALNVLIGNLGKPGGLHFTQVNFAANPFSEILAVTQSLKEGKIKTVFIHGWNPVFELPGVLDFSGALAQAQNVVSFAPFQDETSLWSDYLLPDHSPLESWGYQRTLYGSDRPAISSFQPVVAPLYNTKSTSDILIAAASQAGIPDIIYSDEIEFLQQKLLPQLESQKGMFTAADMPTFWSKWLQHGGWWLENPELTAPPALSLSEIKVEQFSTTQTEPGDLFLVVYPTRFGDGSQANRPWIQETPDSMTTVTWNSWMEIHPSTAAKLGIHNDDLVQIDSVHGSIQVVAYLYPAIRPDTVAIPFGQGHVQFGRYASQRGANPAQLFGVQANQAGDLSFGDIKVTLKSTGKKRPLARLESQHGVYGESQE